MLLTFIISYLVLTVVIGLLAARMVRNTEDFLLAGRSLPLYINAAALFATWFGAETVLGASSAMTEHGLLGVIEDPFGASLCLFLLGALFARPLYRMKILTFGDFYRERYGHFVEMVASIFLILSYLGWIAAQMVAIGIVLHEVSSLEVTTGILIGSAVVILYTFFGGMWSVSITDFIQMILIIVGLVFVLWQLMEKTPLQEVIRHTPEQYFRFIPENRPILWLNYFAAWITIGLGSIPQQDVFQRVMSARSAKVAVRASYTGGLMYLSIALIPLILALYARYLAPGLLQLDSQHMLPALILRHSSLWVQVLFFGALLSAIMSTASGALLAPSAILSENIFNHFLFKNIAKQKLLLFSRLSVLIVAAIALLMALSQSNIYELVGQSSALSLVSLFVPMAAGIYWKKANKPGAILSLLMGMAAWLITLHLDTAIAPLLYGLLASILGMLIGVFVWKGS